MRRLVRWADEYRHLAATFVPAVLAWRVVFTFLGWFGHP